MSVTNTRLIYHFQKLPKINFPKLWELYKLIQAFQQPSSSILMYNKYIVYICNCRIIKKNIDMMI